uniref:Uncharacterized protein n=1 Tax=Cacopsylla melanoneura TaxID=428564 RepID=A0A8D8SN67_9HEMI
MSESTQPECLLTEDEMVESLKNTANLLSSRCILLEAAQLFDERNKTSAQPCNLETLADNFETTAQEYNDMIVTKVLLEEFTKTVDQSIILDHVLSDNSLNSSEDQIKLILENNQLEVIGDQLRHNGGAEKEARTREHLDYQTRIGEGLPQLKQSFVKTKKDEENVEMFNKAQKYLDKMEHMRNITQSMLSEYKFSEVKQDPELWAIYLRTLQPKTLADYYRSEPVANVAEAMESLNIEEPNQHNSSDTNQHNSSVESEPNQHDLSEGSVDSAEEPNNTVLRRNSSGSTRRNNSNLGSAPSNTTLRSEGPNNVTLRTDGLLRRGNASFRSTNGPNNVSFKSGNSSFRSTGGLLDGSRLTRNEVSGIGRLALDESMESDEDVNEVSTDDAIESNDEAADDVSEVSSNHSESDQDEDGTSDPNDDENGINDGEVSSNSSESDQDEDGLNKTESEPSGLRRSRRSIAKMDTNDPNDDENGINDGEARSNSSESDQDEDGSNKTEEKESGLRRSRRSITKMDSSKANVSERKGRSTGGISQESPEPTNRSNNKSNRSNRNSSGTIRSTRKSSGTIRSSRTSSGTISQLNRSHRNEQLSARQIVTDNEEKSDIEASEEEEVGEESENESEELLVEEQEEFEEDNIVEVDEQEEREGESDSYEEIVEEEDEQETREEESDSYEEEIIEEEVISDEEEIEEVLEGEEENQSSYEEEKLEGTYYEDVVEEEEDNEQFYDAQEDVSVNEEHGNSADNEMSSEPPIRTPRKLRSTTAAKKVTPKKTRKQTKQKGQAQQKPTPKRRKLGNRPPPVQEESMTEDVTNEEEMVEDLNDSRLTSVSERNVLAEDQQYYDRIPRDQFSGIIPGEYFSQGLVYPGMVAPLYRDTSHGPLHPGLAQGPLYTGRYDPLFGTVQRQQYDDGGMYFQNQYGNMRGQYGNMPEQYEEGYGNETVMGEDEEDVEYEEIEEEYYEEVEEEEEDEEKEEEETNLYPQQYSPFLRNIIC